MVGKARNTEDVALGWAEAEVKWYGAGGVVLGTSSDLFVDSLEPGEVWEFEVWGIGVDAADVVSYELEVTGTVLE